MMFAPSSIMSPLQCLRVRTRLSYSWEAPYNPHSQSRLQTFKGMFAIEKQSSLFCDIATVYKYGDIISTPGPNVIKLFKSVNY